MNQAKTTEVINPKIKKSLHWDDLRYFLALYRHKKLIPAGKSLQVDHTTVGRRVRELEGVLNTKLFKRTDIGFQVTVSGENLLSYAESIESTLVGLEEKVSDGDTLVEGSVRIGSPDAFGAHFLAPRLPSLLKKYSELEIELIVARQGLSLPRRDVDMMITTQRPTNGRVVIRKLTDYSLGLYASEEYFDYHPPIRSKFDFSNHELIGFVSDMNIDFDHDNLLKGFKKTPFRSCNLAAQYQAVKRGFGLCVLPLFLAQENKHLVRILPKAMRWSGDFWLVVHEDNRHMSRIKKVSDFIAESVNKEKSIFH